MKPVERVLPAMPIWIQYVSGAMDYRLERKRGEHYFIICLPDVSKSLSHLHSFSEGFQMRDDFEQIKTPENALRFLNQVGIFRYTQRWPKRQSMISWGEFQGWQEVVRRIRLRDISDGFPTLGYHLPEFRPDYTRRHAIKEGLGDLFEQIWNVCDDTFDWIQGTPHGLEIRRVDFISEHEATEVDDNFLKAASFPPESREWKYAMSLLARKEAARVKRSREGKQTLVASISPASALDAILATVYVDKLRGLDLQACALKECNEMFERREGSGRMYCTQAHAHLASVRRKRAEAREKKLKRSSRKEKGK